VHETRGLERTEDSAPTTACGDGDPFGIEQYAASELQVVTCKQGATIETWRAAERAGARRIGVQQSTKLWSRATELTGRRLVRHVVICGYRWPPLTSRAKHGFAHSWRQPRALGWREDAEIQDRLPDACEARGVSHSPFLSPQRLDDR
jgi:hypothetical protein